MGQDHSKSKEEKVQQRHVKGDATTSSNHEAAHVDSRIDEAFRRLAAGDAYIHYKRLVELFGGDLAESLWKHFTGDKPHHEAMTHEEFARHALPLVGTSTDIFVRMCLSSLEHLIKICSDAAGAAAVEGDEPFIAALVKDMTSGGSSVNAVCDWRRSVCPNLCQAAHSLVGHHFMGYELNTRDYASDILTPLQMWFLQCCLPQDYFPAKDKKEEALAAHWTPLYSSAQQGISTNRFEACVFGYKGPTVTIFKLADKRTLVIATDQEWRHSGKRFGGPATTLLLLEPKIQKHEAANSIYCNLKLRSEALGISFLEHVKIDKELSDVLEIETWGCSGAKTLQEQQKLKQWQQQQAERNKRVPLPGTWDDNPDKTILEMAGFQFSNERKLMEMEAAHNEQSSSAAPCISRSMAKDPW
ncbi:hypothetical protein WR25_10786 [Diploscapter pachys]|uniref:TLDc domain-containing protein n=1 Tax=Diploscapter pachys TaxID=2018661 RepID=A0A2A2JBD7_9BILA|nr:hypothetical protein WR25_10786 [Diploscapter pachys]